MLIGKNLSLFRILKFTWKIDLLMLAFCGVIYLMDAYWWVSFKLPIAFPALMGTAIAFLSVLIITRLTTAGGKRE